MPILKILTALAVCDFCDARDAHIANRHEPLSAEVFMRRGWYFTDEVTACRRCAPLARLAQEERRDQVSA